MTKKGVRYIQTLFEADDDIAATARILNCPVLSYDSDFYIYDVTYIPFNTLDPFLVKNRKGQGYLKQCRVYKVETLLNQFKGLDRSVLPLAATLLGNDYVKRSTFKDFFCHLRLSKATKRKYNEQQRRIEATFNWLSKHSLNAAIVQILARLPQDSRKKVLEVIEMIVNVYTTVDPKILVPLGFPEQFVTEMMAKFKTEPFKFREDINNLRPVEEPPGEDESEISDVEEEEEEKDESDQEFRYNPNIQKVAPPWFIQEFNMGRYASYFIDILTRRFYVCPPQIEDYSYPAAITISLKIVRVIYGLLTKGLEGPKILEYLCRGQHKNMTVGQIEAEDQMFGCELPTLFTLRDLPPIIRKRMLEETLGIPEFAVETFPNGWKLYAATATYWMAQQQEPSGTNCHLYSLLFTMLFSILDQRIGYHRSEQYFHQRYGPQLNAILLNRRGLPFPQIPQDVTVYQAYCEVTEEDCLLAAPFFLSNFEIDKNLFTNPKKFNVSIVHAFAQFQVCMRHSLHLNALLGFPYQQTRVAELYNGTLLYNLYNNFKGRNDIDAYVFHLLQHSPTLLRLFNVLLAHVKGLLAQNVLDNRVNSGRRRKRRNREKKEEEVLEDLEPTEVFSSFHDANNRFSMLGRYQF